VPASRTSNSTSANRLRLPISFDPPALVGKAFPSRAVVPDPVAPEQANDPRRMLAEAAGGRIDTRGPQADGRTIARTRGAALVPRGGCRSRTLHRHGCDPAAKSWDRSRDLRRHREETVETGMSEDMSDLPTIEGISAVSLVTHDMARAVRFYRALGFTIRTGGEQASFTSLHAGSGYLNLIARPVDHERSWWGRVIFHVSDVDAFHARAVAAGLGPDTAPADAPWAERFFHLTDPDGHELSFARPLSGAGTPRPGGEG
jgi:catechol 2,3-dioxygenase-like lactoylglutathione lyase family enzyme